jgi:cytochrome c
MANGARLAALAGLALALGACDKSGTTPAEQPGALTQPAAAPADLTEVQKKALLAQLPAAYQTADLDNGEAKSAACKSCHTLAQGGPDMIGPNLWGVFGRKAGSKADFSYSDDLKAAGWTWDAPRLDRWITNPRGVLPGTKMSYGGLPDARDRTDLIAYLKVTTSPPPAS